MQPECRSYVIGTAEGTYRLDETALAVGLPVQRCLVCHTSWTLYDIDPCHQGISSPHVRLQLLRTSPSTVAQPDILSPHPECTRAASLIVYVDSLPFHVNSFDVQLAMSGGLANVLHPGEVGDAKQFIHSLEGQLPD